MSQHELAALQTPGLDGLVFGEVADRLSRGSLDERVRLARYEQFAGREQAADQRLRAVIAHPEATGKTLRDARSQQRLGAVFEPEFTAEDIDWFSEQPPTELDAAGIRERLAILWGRMMLDGREPAGGWPDDFVPASWETQEKLIEETRSALLRRLARAKLAELLDLFDLSIWTSMLLLTQNDGKGSLEILAHTRRAHARNQLRALEHFLDYQTGVSSVGVLDLAAAGPLLERGLEGFAKSRDRRWWMHGKAVQALIASVSNQPMPPEMPELERALVSGTWRTGRRSLGQSTLMMLGSALASHGDLEGARRLVLADGGLDELTVCATDRSSIIEIIFNCALSDGDLDTCERMIHLADHLMLSPTIKLVQERLHATMDAQRHGVLPDRLPESEADPSFEILRTRWMILAQTVAHGSRGEAWGALADFDAFTGRTAAAAMRQRAIGLLHDRVAAPTPKALSPRQLEVATLAGAGFSNAEIANELFLSLRTVEDYLGQALRRLGLQQRVELATVELPLELKGRDRGLPPLRLPLRQGQVGALISAGASNAEIAEVLAISKKTLDIHISALKKKLNASTRTELAALFAA